MKSFKLFLLAIAQCAIISYAQDVNTQVKNLGEVQYTFVRPSMSFLSLSFRNAGQSFDVNQLPKEDRFDFNELSKYQLSVAHNYVMPLASSAGTEAVTARKKAYNESSISRKTAISDALSKSQIGNEILSSLLLDANGQYSRSKLNKRAQLSKVDDDVISESTMKVAEIDQKALSTIVSQLSRIYITSMSLIDISTVDTKESEGYSTNSYVAIARLKFEEIEPAIKKAISTKADLKSVLSSLNVTWEVVYEGEFAASSTQGKPLTYTPSGNVLADAAQKKMVETVNKKLEKSRVSMEVLKSRLPQAVYDAQNLAVTKKVEDFKPKAPIFATSPILIKVGKKESVSKGQRWEVLETKEKGDKTILVHRGYLRASKVVDNSGVATGNTTPSKFYQIQGKKLDEGMLATWNDDLGVAVRVSYLQKLSPENYTMPGLVHIDMDASLASVYRGMKAGLSIQIDRDTRQNVENDYISFVGLNFKQAIPITRNSEFEFGVPVMYGIMSENDGYLAIATQPSLSLNINVAKTAQLNLISGYRWATYNLDATEASIVAGGGLTFNF